MEKWEYCINVCGGKCCTLYPPGEEPIRCPKLADNNSCTVYHKRYGPEFADMPVVVVGQWESKKRKDIDGNPVVLPFMCGRIADIIASGAMPLDVMEQCCYAHPELLEVKSS